MFYIITRKLTSHNFMALVDRSAFGLHCAAPARVAYSFTHARALCRVFSVFSPSNTVLGSYRADISAAHSAPRQRTQLPLLLPPSPPLTPPPLLAQTGETNTPPDPPLCPHAHTHLCERTVTDTQSKPAAGSRLAAALLRPGRAPPPGPVVNPACPRPCRRLGSCTPKAALQPIPRLSRPCAGTPTPPTPVLIANPARPPRLIPRAPSPAADAELTGCCESDWRSQATVAHSGRARRGRPAQQRPSSLGSRPEAGESRANWLKHAH